MFICFLFILFICIYYFVSFTIIKQNTINKRQPHKYLLLGLTRSYYMLLLLAAAVCLLLLLLLVSRQQKLLNCLLLEPTVLVSVPQVQQQQSFSQVVSLLSEPQRNQTLGKGVYCLSPSPYLSPVSFCVCFSLFSSASLSISCLPMSLLSP